MKLFDITFTLEDNSGKIYGSSVRSDGWYLLTLCSKGLSLIPSIGMHEDEYDVDIPYRKLKIVGVDVI